MKRLLTWLLTFALAIPVCPVYAQESIPTAVSETTQTEMADVVIDATEYGADPTGMGDSAEAIWQAFEAAKEASENGTKSVTVYFPKGEYHVYKDRAQQREYHTSNTSSTDAPYHNKHIGILIEDQKNLTIEGDGSLFMIHGDMMALAVVRSENIKLHNFSWDYAVPTVTEMTIVDMGTEDGRAYTDFYIPQCFPYEIQGNTILWKSDVSPYTGEPYWTRRGEHDNSYSVVTHQPKEEMSRAYYSGQGPFQDLTGLKQLEDNKVRIYYSYRPDMQNLGMVFQFCSSAVRPTAGAFTWESKEVTAEKVNVHYMDGFGWLIQMSENVYYKDCNLMPRDNSGHLTVSYADGIHASGAKGKIVIDNCNFSYTHDDPINIHGTFTRVEQRVDDYTLVLKYIHAQQGGFPQFHVGDEVQFFTRDTLESTDNETVETVYTVAEVISNPGENGNDLKTMKVRFEEALPSNLSERIGSEPKYVAENVTYAPEVTITDCTFKNIVTRGILCTTRNKVLIENNIFYPTSMATIFLSNDSDQWYESGPIRDMTIRGNVFYVDDIGRTSWAYAPAIYIHPVTKGGGLPAATNPIHKNITVEDNVFYMNEDVVVKAESVENLVFRNNTVLRKNPDVTLTLNPTATDLNTGEAMSLNFQKRGNTNDKNIDNVFHFTKSKNVTIAGNTYDDGLKRYVVADADTQSTLNVEDTILTVRTDEGGSPSSAVGEVTFVNSDPDVLYVANDGTVTGLKEGTATIYAYYEWNGTIIKSNEVTLHVSGEPVQEEADGKVSITTTSKNEDFSVAREDESHYEMTNDSYTIDMQGGDLWQQSNTLKNLLLYEPTTVDKEDLRVMVKVTGMPVSESGQWDTASFMLYKDDDNYITVGKKSHYNGFCYVVEKNGSADEQHGNSADNNVTSGYLGITNVGGTVTLSAKAEGGTWKEVATITSHTIGEDYKIGFAAWETYDRSKTVTFSDFKVGTSQDTFEELEASDSVSFFKEDKTLIEKNPRINTDGFLSNHAKLDNITIEELGFSKTASAESSLDSYYYMVAEEGNSEVTFSVTKDSDSDKVQVLHGDYRTELPLEVQENTYTTAPISLRQGINTFYVRVYAEDGITYKQHIVAVTYTPDYTQQELSDGFVKEIIFEGEDVTRECMIVGESAKKTWNKDSVHLKVTAQEGAEVTFGLEGSQLPEAVASVMEADVNLKQGEQRIKIVITSNGEEKVYYLNVEKALYLSDLAWLSATVGYGDGVNKDRNHNGNQISLTGENGEAVWFEKGLGVHAESVIKYDISDINYNTLEGYVGIDHCQYAADYGDVQFIVLVDNEQVYDSGMMTKTSPMKKVEITISEGAKALELRALKGENNWNDHADWAYMKFSNLYTVSFDDGTNITTSKVEEGGLVSKPADPVKEGYEFKGWYVGADVYDFETEVKADFTITAKFEQMKVEPVTYVVTFNSGEGASEVESQTVVENELAKKPTDPVKEGYDFIGWYVGEKEYDFNTSVTGDITLTAMWKEKDNSNVEQKEYKITYKLNGGENNPENPTNYTEGNEEIKLQAPTRKGYTFVNWYSNKSMTKKATKIKANSTGDKTFYAKWKKETYKISYKLDGGKNSSKNPKSYQVTTATIKLKAPTKKGYTFEGWYSDKEFTKKVTSIKTGSAGDVKLYAKWSLNTYKISYKLNGGTNSDNNPDNYTVESKSIKLKKPTKSGYKFVGWYSDKKMTKKVTKIKAGSTGKVTLYAKWKKK